MARNEHILYFRLLDPRMVDSSIMFTKYVSKWATNLRAISLNVGVRTFGPPCILQSILGLDEQLKLYLAFFAMYLKTMMYSTVFTIAGVIEI